MVTCHNTCGFMHFYHKTRVFLKFTQLKLIAHLFFVFIYDTITFHIMFKHSSYLKI